MVNNFLIETLEDYRKLYDELEEIGTPKEALEIVKKSIDVTNLLIKEREAREIESRVLPLVPVAEASAHEEDLGLTVGVYKNFKAFCIAGGKLEADYKEKIGGNQRKRLEKEMNLICKWKKVKKGNAIIVDEVYQFEKDIEDGRSKNNIYIDSAEGLIIQLMQLLLLQLET